MLRAMNLVSRTKGKMLALAGISLLVGATHAMMSEPEAHVTVDTILSYLGQETDDATRSAIEQSVLSKEARELREAIEARERQQKIQKQKEEARKKSEAAIAKAQAEKHQAKKAAEAAAQKEEERSFTNSPPSETSQGDDMAAFKYNAVVIVKSDKIRGEEDEDLTNMEGTVEDRQDGKIVVLVAEKHWIVVPEDAANEYLTLKKTENTTSQAPGLDASVSSMVSAAETSSPDPTPRRSRTAYGKDAKKWIKKHCRKILHPDPEKRWKSNGDPNWVDPDTLDLNH